jgi:diguanylate cyclase (GGDEF)-like protein
MSSTASNPNDDTKERSTSSNRLGRALEHVLTELSHASVSVLGNDDYKRNLERVRKELARALVPADYADVTSEIMKIHFPVKVMENSENKNERETTIGKGETATLLGLADIAKNLGLSDTGEQFRYLAANKDELDAQTFEKDMNHHIEKTEAAASALRQMNQILQTGISQITDSLTHLAQANPGARDRIAKIKQRLIDVQDVPELEKLRTAIMEETQSLIREAEERESELTRVRSHINETKSRARSLEAALEEAEEIARTDPLTTMGNRRALDEHAKSLAQSRVPVAILLIDIDNFKSINDTNGHETGDMVLKHIGTRITRALRGGDRAFRIGGDEIAILLTNARKSSAAAVARRINEVIGDRPVTVGDKKVDVTLSIGVADWKSGEKYSQAQARADEALYLAKSQGRNQVCVD